MSNLKPLVVILGPTASGKSEVGLRLAKKFNGEIVNADSRQIYKEMLIATGSPILENQKLNCHSEFISESFPNNGLIGPMPSKLSVAKIGVSGGYKRKILKQSFDYAQYDMVQDDKFILINKIPHHLFHFIKPSQKFSVAEYKNLAIKIIRDIHRRGKIPILVGGTGLYISSVVDNLEIPASSPNDKIRARLGKHTKKYLFNKLQKIDSKSASIIGENNKRKLIRALEVFELTGRPFSAQQIKGEPLFNALQIGIKTDRKKLYKNIDKRVDEMIKIGLVEETKKLREKHSFDLPAMSGIGYFEIGQYLENKMSLDEAIQKMKYRTHQYARRQMTWFKRNTRIKWVNNFNEAKIIMKIFLKNVNFKNQKSK
jgi:tRNA dimethylallyltransferase